MEAAESRQPVPPVGPLWPPGKTPNPAGRGGKLPTPDDVTRALWREARKPKPCRERIAALKVLSDRLPAPPPKPKDEPKGPDLSKLSDAELAQH